MAAFPISRGPLLILSILIITAFVLRAFLSVPSASSLGSRRQITMLTFNIWYPSVKMKERMNALGEIVQNLKPDILTFQEVTLDNLALLRRQHWFDRYNVVPPDPELEIRKHEGKHFVVILTVYPVDKWFIYPLKNSPVYHRKLVRAETKRAVSSNVRFVIATTHLVHAASNTQKRELQLKETLKVLSGYKNVCVMGDMNINEGKFKADGEVVLPYSWSDAWLSLPGNTVSNGNTWDQSRNAFASMQSNTNTTKIYKARVDRVFCKLSDFKVKEMRIVGNESTKSGVLPSDHFGLFTIIELSSRKTQHKKTSAVTEVFFKRSPDWGKLINQKDEKS